MSFESRHFFHKAKTKTKMQPNTKLLPNFQIVGTKTKILRLFWKVENYFLVLII